MKQSSIEWLVSEFMSKGIINADAWVWDDNVDILAITNQAKEMRKKELEATYNHAMWALVDTGHGESFDEYYNETYESKH